MGILGSLASRKTDGKASSLLPFLDLCEKICTEKSLYVARPVPLGYESRAKRLGRKRERGKRLAARKSPNTTMHTFYTAMETRSNQPKLRLSRTCCDLLLAFKACNSAFRYSMENPQQGANSLHQDARLGHADLVRILLKDPGIEVNARDALGETPLHWAAIKGHAAVVQPLLQVHGIELNIRNNRDKTPLQLSQEQLQVATEEDLKQRLSACIALLSKPVGS